MTGSQIALPCPRCRRGTQDGLLCDPCLHAFQTGLGALATLLPEVATTVHRKDRVSRAIRHRGVRPDWVEAAAAVETAAIPANLRSWEPRTALAAHPAPINLSAVDVAAGVRFGLVTWLGHLHQRYGAPDRPIDHLHRPCWDLRCDHPGCWAARAWREPICWALYLCSDDVRADDAAAAIVADVLAAARRVEAMVDRREAEVFVGRCDAPDVAVTLEDGTIGLATDRVCGAHLYAQLGDRVVACEACGEQYPVAERREWLLEQVRVLAGRPVQIVRWLAAFDVDLTAERLDQWISRDRRRHEVRCLSVDPPWAIPACTHLWPVGLESVDGDGVPCGRPVYSAGAVLDRVEVLRVQFEERRAAQLAAEAALAAGGAV